MNGFSCFTGGLPQNRICFSSREPFFVLVVFLLVLLPFSLWVFGRAVRRAKREGSLIQY